MKVLFVCSGNICRSAMAAAYFRHRAGDRGLSHVVVDSAGTLDIEGAPASAESVEVLREIGVDLSGHRSKALTEAQLWTSDLVIGMTRDHLETIAVRDTAGSARRYLLRAFERGAVADPNAADLEDPIGRSLEFYREQRELLLTCLDHLAIHLRHLR